MPEQEVLSAIGRPARRDQGEYTGEEIWTYRLGVKNGVTHEYRVL